MLQKAGVVVILFQLGFQRKAHRSLDLQLIVIEIRTVAAHPLALPVLGRGKSGVPCQLRHIVLNTVLVTKFGGVELAAGGLLLEHKVHAVINNGLALHRGYEPIPGNVNIRKHLNIRLPANAGAGIALVVRLLVQAADVLALFKMQGIAIAVPVNFRVHIFRRILGGAKPQAVKAQGELITACAAGVIIFGPGIHLAKQQLPVFSLLVLVVIHRNTAAKVLHLIGAVQVAGHHDPIAAPLSGLVYGVAHNFKDGMLTAL